MNIENKIKNCEINLKQLNQFDPDPHYVEYFLDKLIVEINEIKEQILEEINTELGLFVSGKISERKLHEKAKLKKDSNTMKFLEWYIQKQNDIHKNSYPKMMEKIILFKTEFKKLPEIKIMLRASCRYKDDVNHQIKVSLKDNKLRSKEELQIEIRRQTPMFLETINNKRSQKNEPNVKKDQVVATTCVDIEEFKNIEILYTSQIYTSIIKKLADESRDKIKEILRKN